MESRFSALFPMLIKQKLKDSGSGHQKLQQACTTASRAEQETFLSRSLSTLDRLKMIYALAKSEIRTGQDINSYLPALNERVSAVCERPITAENGLFLEDRDLFPCCLFVSVAVTHKQPAIARDLFQNLLTRAQIYLQNKADNFL